MVHGKICTCTIVITQDINVLSCHFLFRYFKNPIDSNDDESSVSNKTLLKTQDVRGLVTNQNKLLDNLGGMKRDIGNLDKEIDTIRKGIRSSSLINGTGNNYVIGSSLGSAVSIPGSAGSRRSTSAIGNIPTARPSRRSYTPGSYVPGSYVAGQLSSRYASATSRVPPSTTLLSHTEPGVIGVTSLIRETRVRTIPPAGGITYTPVGTVSVTTRPRGTTSSYSSLASSVYPTTKSYRSTRASMPTSSYPGDWDDLDNTAIGTYSASNILKAPITHAVLGNLVKPPSVSSVSNRVFHSTYSPGSKY